MKIKTIICTLLCALCLSTAVFATGAETVVEETQHTQQPTGEETMQTPKNGEFAPGEGMGRGMRRGGRGFGRGMQTADGESTAENETMQPPQNWQENPDGGRGFGGMEPQKQQPSQDSQSQMQEAKDRYNFTYIASAVLLLIGFLFAKFYKRRSF